MNSEPLLLSSRPWFFARLGRGFPVLGICFLLGVLGLIPTLSQGADWEKVTSHIGNFSVQLPGEVQYKKDEADTKMGKLILHNFIVEDDLGTSVYLVICTEYPKALLEQRTTQQILDDAAGGAVGTGDLQSKKEIVHDGCEGRELVFTKPGEPTQNLRWRIMLFDGNLYQVGCVSIGNEVNQEIFSLICDSFTILRK